MISSRSLSLALLIILICVSMVQAAAKVPANNGKAPKDAIILFDGKSLSKWVQCGSDQPACWKIENGYTTTSVGDICTKQHFKDCKLHVEFWLPKMSEATGQARANSGVFFMGFSYEVQILDSYGLECESHNCGAIYSISAPKVNACKPPEQWQSYDITFHAPRFDKDGKKTANARMTVYQNGVLVQDNVEVPYKTPDHSLDEPKTPGPIELQYHNCQVRFRNVWVKEL